MVDGNYDEVRAIVVARATDVVWIDPRKSVVMAQVVGRSIHRAVTRRELWNGNRENWRDWASPDHPIRWAWATYDRKQVTYPAAVRRPRPTPTSGCIGSGADEKRGSSWLA